MNKVIVLGILVTTLAGCAEVVDNGNRGVKKTYGKVADESLVPGFYWYNPFSTDIIEMNVQTIKWEEKTAAYTKDIQQATIAFAITYHLSPNKTHLMYQQVGLNWAETLLAQVVAQAIKDEFGRWNAVNVISNRGQLQNNITTNIKSKLLTRNIIMDGFEITNIDYSHSFEKAVEDKEVAVQRAIEEQNKTKQVEEQGKQTVIAANAEAEAMKVRANALEKNPKLIEYEAVTAWKETGGKMPTTMIIGDSKGVLPFLPIGK